jgi:hypothetical protein
MKFIVARTRLQRNLLDGFFESYYLTRDAQTKELRILWRPVRLFGLFFGLLTFLYVGAILAVTWWLQDLAPGLNVRYADVANPVHWSHFFIRWQAYQKTYALPTEPVHLGDNQALAAAINATAHVGAPGSTHSGAAYTIADNPLVSANPYGPLLTQYFLHNGGTQELLGILSIQIHGTVTMQSGETLKFTMVKKPPGKVRINMHDDVSNKEATVLTDGQKTWKWTGDPYANGVTLAPPDEAAALAREAMYCDIPVEIIHNPHFLSEIPRELGEDQPDNYIQTILASGMRALIFLNPDTWRADRVQIDYDQNGVPCTYTILVREWMTVAGVSEPALIDVYVNGTKLLQCRFDSITYNPGAYDVLFEPPGDAASAPLAAPAASAKNAAPPAPLQPLHF